MDSTGTEPTPSEMESIVPPRYDIPANGTYTLTRGELITGATEIGIGGVGRFVQSGGVHQVGGVLRVGGRPYLRIMSPDDPTQTSGYTGDGTQMPEIWPYPGPSDRRYTITGGRVRAARLEIAAGYRPWYLEYPKKLIPFRPPFGFAA